MGTELATKVANATVEPAKAGTGVLARLGNEKKAIERQLPANIDKDRWFGILLAECRRNPKLLICDPDTIVGAVATCSRLGLEVGSAQGHAYLIPFGTECVLVIGYQGYLELARRAGCHIVAREVHENDTFDIDYGTETVVHKPNFRDRGKVFGYYGVARFADGRQTVHYLTIEDVERHKKYSKGADKSDSPWKTNYDAMARKSVVREMVPYVPTTPEDRGMAIAYNSEEHVIRAKHVDDFIDVAAIEDPPEIEISSGAATRDEAAKPPPAETSSKGTRSRNKAPDPVPDTKVPENPPVQAPLEAASTESTPEGTADGGKPPEDEPTLDAGQMRRIRALFGGLKISDENHTSYITDMMEWEGNPCEHVSELTIQEANDVIKALERHTREASGDPGPQEP